MVNFPTSLDSFANPTAGSYEDDVGLEHHTQHSNANDAIEALEAKLGIGASTPIASRVMRGTGTGTSSWGQVATGDITDGAISQSGLAAGSTASPTTTSTTFVDMTDMTVTLSITNSVVYAWFTGTFLHSAGLGIIGLNVDGGSEVVSNNISLAGSTLTSISLMWRFTGLSAGSHTFKARWKTNTGTLTNNAAERWLMVQEIKK